MQIRMRVIGRCVWHLSVLSKLMASILPSIIRSSMALCLEQVDSKKKPIKMTMKKIKTIQMKVKTRRHQ